MNIRFNAAVLAAILCSSVLGCGSGIAPLPPLNVPQTDAVIFTGDSISALWPVDPGFQSHPNWISKGISGETSYLVAQRYFKDVISHYPKTIHIIVGTNDLNPYNNWKSCTAPTFGVIVPGDTCANLLYMVQTAQFYGIKVVIGTIPPWACADDPHCGNTTIDESQDRYTHIAQLNSYLKTFAQQHGVTLIDYHTLLQDSTGLHYAPGLTLEGDGVHPDPQGFAIMTSAVTDAVK